MRTKFRIIAALFVFAALGAAVKPDGARWWSYVEFLASDKLEGRNTGSDGHRKAAEYAAAQFEKDGLKPAGEQGFVQPVKFITKALDESKSGLTLERNGKSQMLKPGEDAIISTRVDPPPLVEAGLVFVGYGLAVPEIHYDDFAGLDTKGKIAVYLTGAPSALSSELSAHYQSTKERAAALRKVGIIGAIAVQNPKHMDLPWSRIAANRLQMAMALAAPGMDDTAGLRILVNWNPAHAEELLSGTGHSLDELVSLAESGKQLPRFPISGKITARTTVKHGAVESQNIAAIWPGADPKLKDEYVALSAHIDHLGVGAPVNGDAIFNGAMDNAAGSAALLDIAAHLKETGAKTKRSILFVLVTGEEKGLLGSKYFAAHPTVPAKSIVADINLDEFLPLFPLRILTVYGVNESTLGDDIRAIAGGAGVKVVPDPEPARNVFIRSDQYNFVLHGIPALMPAFGTVKGSPEDAALNKWNQERYHAVSDDLSQPVDKPAAGEFDLLMAQLVERIADADSKPAWKPTSFFKPVRHKLMPDWKAHGIRIVRAGELDTNTAQTPGMTRAAAITHARTGADKLWAGTVVVQPAARTGAHHHGEVETVLYIVKGRARFRWGDRLEFSEEAGPGDFIYVPPWAPHQEMNARADEPVEAVVVRSGQEPVVVNLDIAEANEFPVPFHPRPGEAH